MKKIIVSLDNFKGNSFDKRLERVIENKDKIYALKLSPTSFNSVDYIRDLTGLKIIYDHQKLADTPWTIENIVSKISINLLNNDGMILLGYVGSKSIETFIESCKNRQLDSYVVIKMSHEKSDEFLREDAPEKICEISASLGVTGVICPVNENYLIKKSRQIIDKINPGIKIAVVGCEDFDDARYAILNGANHIVTGRYFFNSPRNIFERLLLL
ncbi:hypothetical protein HZA33_03115 [Candidatus Pacearchaeota archaeon]|nr:hypothetical protein [Candidatus Pacearchaeota archaeon]